MISVDSNAVERMLMEHGATASCPSCKRNDWVTLAGGWTAELPLTGGAGVVPDVIALACRQCGFLRLHVDPDTAFDAAVR
jgi:hypothetical protein